MDWADKVVLVTGGTGSFGRAFAEIVLRERRPRELVLLSRDESKQLEVRRRLGHPGVRFVIADVRDRDRLQHALRGAHLVVHAAALKHVGSCEENPGEAVATNVLGTRHVIDAAFDAGVERLLALSTDKAVSPAGVYGATKLLAERLVVGANAPRGAGPTRLACVRLGNIIGSRGSVIPHVLEQRRTGTVTVTDERATRFWISPDESARFALRCLDDMSGGEIFVPKLPSLSLGALLDVLAPGCRRVETGLRPGEKRHESLIAAEEAARTVELDDLYVVQPEAVSGGRAPEGLPLSSGDHPRRLRADELLRLTE